MLIIDNDLVSHKVEEAAGVEFSGDTGDKGLARLGDVCAPPVLELLPRVVLLQVVDDGDMVEEESAFITLVDVRGGLEHLK